MLVFYVNQPILFKYCNLGGYNWLYIWLKWGRYEMDVLDWKADEMIRLILCGMEMGGTHSL